MELQPTDYNYRIKYYFYIGTDVHVVTLSNEPEGPIITSNGKGVVKIFKDKPYREPVYVDKRILMSYNILNKRAKRRDKTSRWRLLVQK